MNISVLTVWSIVTIQYIINILKSNQLISEEDNRYQRHLPRKNYNSYFLLLPADGRVYDKCQLSLQSNY